MPMNPDAPDDSMCDCGVPVDSHPPLPPPKPLGSWKSERSTSAQKVRPSNPPSGRSPLNGWHKYALKPGSSNGADSS